MEQGYDIGYHNGPLAILCHVVYATMGFRQFSVLGPAGRRSRG